MPRLTPNLSSFAGVAPDLSSYREANPQSVVESFENTPDLSLKRP